MARLGRLVGRGRALEIPLGGDDIPADLAARYGYVDHLIPDAQIENVTDAFAAGEHGEVQLPRTCIPVAFTPVQNRAAVTYRAFPSQVRQLDRSSAQATMPGLRRTVTVGGQADR
ncbi:Clp protease/crotonase-like domain-containing protein [Actinacidiphila bryophytorum]|uniref:Uncharacterized protein n=1 Tax=Actinacidiphila bryophytorum TaxID=1436133 RepID=A0A9W4H4P1_9ACTN|nr:hypothetical protein [Actinacidiphila bryophytorum]MBM9435779.1 hypothetical protein [Actinacidiphila bryophytorum]CAG7650279.1 hypothetical protein SBRY_50317 [Actinacidiphila bryophytorum]